jgi:predicted amidophosphoribosyltransferase
MAKKKKIDNTFTADKDTNPVVFGTCEGCDAEYDVNTYNACPHCRDTNRSRRGRDTDEHDNPLPLDRMMGWFRF